MRLNSIQFLRAIAVLLVVFEHSMDVQIKFGTSWQQNVYHLDNFGCIGVDLFFVISGFIIAHVAAKYQGLNEGLYFLEKRLFRINPVYYIATIVFLAMYLFQYYINDATPERSFRQIITSLMDSILIIPTYESIIYFTPLLIVGWTLSFEWLFYILYFISIILVKKRKIVVLSGLILILVGTGQLLQPHDLRLQFITNPIILEFLLGVIICQIYLYFPRIPAFVGVTFLSIGLVGYLYLIRFGYGNVWYYLATINGKVSLDRFLLWGIPSACIVSGCVFMEKNRRLMNVWNNKYLLLIGNASYSIYLIHYTVLVLLKALYLNIGLNVPPDILIWVQLALSIFISIGFYKLIEKPLLKWLQTKTLWSITKPERQKFIIVGSKAIEKIEPMAS